MPWRWGDLAARLDEVGKRREPRNRRGTPQGVGGINNIGIYSSNLRLTKKGKGANMTTENTALTIKERPTTLHEVNLPAMMKTADTLIKSGFLPQAIKTSAQAVAIIMTGRELGIPTMQALRQINVIQGKPTMAAELMLALAYQHIPGFTYQVKKSTATECTCVFTRPGHAAHEHTFTIADAQGLGLAGKDNWKKQPATMLRWRCISSGLRLVAPDAIAGVYTPEEIVPDMPVNYESGTVIEVIEDAPREENIPTMPLNSVLDTPIATPVQPLATDNVGESYKNYSKVKELVKDCEPDAVAWCIKNGWIKEGEHMGQVSDANNLKILSRPPAFLTAVKSTAQAIIREIAKKGPDGKAKV